MPTYNDLPTTRRVGGPRATRPPRRSLFRRTNQWHQESAKIVNHRAEGVWCGRHTLASQESTPLGRPRRREFAGQTDRDVNRQRGSAALESASHRFNKDGLTQFECPCDQPKIIEIL